MTINKIIDMVAVRNSLMTAAGAVVMIGGMAGAPVVWRAVVGVGGGDIDDMLIDVVTMDMMKMAVMQIVDMCGVADGDMAAAGAVLMAVVGVMGMGANGHCFGSLVDRVLWLDKCSDAWSIAL